MKKTILLLFAAAALMLPACEPDVIPALSVDNTALNVDSQGGSIGFTITSNTAWEIATDGQTWYSLSPVSGEGNATITLTVERYTEAAARAAAIRVTGAGKTLELGLVQRPPLPPADPGKLELNEIALGGTREVEVPAGFAFSTESSADWLSVSSREEGRFTLVISPNTQGDYREGTVRALLTDGSLLAEVKVNQSWRNVEPGQLLIEEVYFTGSPIEGSTTPSGDQYIKLTNNCDHTVYADRVLFVTNFISGTKTSVGAYYDYPEPGDGIVATDMYRIPGDGDDFPVAPGKSVILALAAQNYRAENPLAIDLSKADFEFYDENDIYPDTDNPDVRNLEIWFKSSATITSLHNRGFESYAIVTPPEGETAASIMTDHHWSGQYSFHFKEWNFTYDIADEDAWLLPGSWVIDAVNCSLQDSYYRNPWGAAFDAGWTHAGEYDKDPSRFGKSVRRRSESGKLVDTNNSTNDFTPNAEPSLK